MHGVFQKWCTGPNREKRGSVVNTGRYADNCILYLSWDLELLHYPHIKEAADATLDEFKL